MPVVEADGRTIAGGKPGPITQTIGEAYRELVRREGTPLW